MSKLSLTISSIESKLGST